MVCCGVTGQTGMSEQSVEQNVQKALQAVVEMDGDLKKDLKKVKEGIKIGIDHVIKTLQVNELDEKVKNDLESLRGKIEGLNNGDELADGPLKALAAQKKILDEGAVKSIKDEVETKLESKFNPHIQGPLSQAVGAVDSAIEKLGQQFSLKGDPKKLKGIFKYIKERVGEIKGNKGSGDWQNTGGSGLDGIKSKVEDYFNAFGRGKFEGIVKGWLDDMVDHNGVVQRILMALGWHKNEFNLKSQNVDKSLTWNIRETLGKQIPSDGASLSVTADITQKITKVKEACQTFAGALDKELKNPANDIVEQVKAVRELMKRGGQNPKCICECGCYDYGYSDKKEACAKKAAAELILCALSSVARQVGNELNSVFLNDGSEGSLASILDKITPIATDLNNKLTQATENSDTQGVAAAIPKPGTAQAVDTAIGNVKTFVTSDLESKFTNQVKQPLAEAVLKLPGAVQQFDSEAQEQIKQAAKTAIEKAAEEIKQDNKGQIEFRGDFMNTFDEAHKKIRDELDRDLKQKVDEHIGQDDLTGGQSGQGFQKVELNTDHFDKYNTHVDQQKIKALNGGKTLQGTKDANEGSLPLAIGNIKTQGLDALEKHIGDKPTEKIDDDTFTVPFETIKTQLEEIKTLVDGESDDDDQKGVMTLLNKLKSALDSGMLERAEKGLDAIKQAIHALQQDQFTKQPAAIEEAVQEIRKELGELRQKLKNNSKDDVIERLTDLNTAGLGDGDWNGKKTSGGQNASGLGKIESELQEQNDALKKHSDEIGNAVADVASEFGMIGIKFQNIFSRNDILDKLKALKDQIGEGKKSGLEAIKNAIQQLQQNPFKTHPTTIGDAKQQIVNELTTLQGVLQGAKYNDVIKTLEDLKGDGLSDKEWNHGENKKGLAKITSELQHQQKMLNDQPTEIQTGVTQITGDLNTLRGTLNEHVTDKLQKLKQHGLEKGEQPWNDSDFKTGLTKITSDIETIKTRDVKDVKDKLKELCTAIRTEANELMRDLKRLKGDGLDELRNIYSDLYDLYFGPLNNVIQSLKAFEKYAVLAACLICF
ncbi:Extracellular matrix-binding ebh, putative [Babesia ovata]|uniref:Extracellular matrix-binding ebh, putative n=1 Tax=Babesia ovata TaxID=189622 RepID=A0A2H6KDT2_9APIC|nr:Extracellular matrix-binding ebh, putative [Babesia ovata]GBE61153.1 Extracellular matrix-binding ebh, putative [Babesia ovata]